MYSSRRQHFQSTTIYSDAEDWFDELPQEEKKDWMAIEVSFRKRWLKEEVLSIKETVATENEPHPTSSALSTMSHSLGIGHPTCADTSQSPAPLGNGKKLENNQFKRNYCENSSVVPIFSSPTPSSTLSDPTALSTGIKALETRSKMVNFAQKPENTENTPISSQTTSKITTPGTVGPINDVTQAYATLPTPNDAFFQPPTSSISASSSPTQHLTGNLKSALLCAVFESKPPTGFLAPTSIITTIKSRLESASFMKIHQKHEKSHIFPKIVPESLVSGHSKWMDDIYSFLPPPVIVTAFETCSTTAYFMKIHQKVEKSTNFNQNHLKLLVSGCFFIELLPTSSIAPTKHPCDLSEDYNVYFSHFICQTFSQILISYYFNFVITCS